MNNEDQAPELTFTVETPEEVDAIVKQYGAEGMEYEGGDESPRHICHVKSPHGLLYFYAPDEKTARDIWEHWFPEHREARERAESEE